MTRNALGLMPLFIFVLMMAGCSQELGVRDVVPKTGVMTGGEPVEILGSGFHTGMGISVYIGTKKADNVTIRGTDKLTFSTPSADVEGTVDIRIMLDSGQEFRMEKAFTYIEKSSSGMDIREMGARKSRRGK